VSQAMALFGNSIAFQMTQDILFIKDLKLAIK
jgi:hypothetical protein